MNACASRAPGGREVRVADLLGGTDRGTRETNAVGPEGKCRQA